MNRDKLLESAFYRLKAAGETAASSIQNDCGNSLLLLQLIDSQKEMQQAFNDAWKIIVNLPE